MAVSYWWPNSTFKAQAASLAAYASGVMAPSWLTTQVVWQFSISGNGFLVLLPYYIGVDGGVAIMPLYAPPYPTSPFGLPAGSIWINGGVLSVIGPVAVVPSLPLFLNDVTPAQLFALGGFGLPQTDPLNPGQLWNNGGVISISLWTSYTPSPPAPVAPPNSTNPRNGLGYYAAGADASGNAWLMSENAPLLTYLPETSSQNGFIEQLDTGTLLTGMAVGASGNSYSSTAYAVDASGNLFLAPVAVPYPGYGANPTKLSPGFATLARCAAIDEAYLYTLLPDVSAFGYTPLGGGGSFGSVAAPMTYPGMLSAFASGVAISGVGASGLSGGVAVGGWSQAAIPSGATAFSAYASGNTMAAFCNASGMALLTGSEPTWSITSQLTGLSGCDALAWNPDGSQILVSTSSNVTVAGIVEGSLTLDQTVSVSSADAIAVTPDGTNALVCQPGLGTVSVLLNSLDIWSVASTFSVTSPEAILLTGNQNGWVLTGTNLVPITRSGNVWSPGSPVALGFIGRAIAMDQFGDILVTGGSGTNGNIALISSGIFVSGLIWSGSYGVSIQTTQGQIAVLASDGQTIRIYSSIGGGLALKSVAPNLVPSGGDAIGSTAASIWMCGSAAIWQEQWNQPFQIRRRRTGIVGLYWNSSWYSFNMNVGHDPGAVMLDASGNVWAVTNQNELWKFSLSGATVSGQSLPLTGYSHIPVYAGQTAGTTLGMSSLLAAHGDTYASALFPGAVINLGTS